MTAKRNGEPSSDIQRRTIKASTIQAERQKKRNADLTPDEIDIVCMLDAEAESLLKLAILELGISVIAYNKILKVARTIADLEAKYQIEAHHVSEAISYRSLDRNLWG
jgi:magnesium chelatase family protein